MSNFVELLKALLVEEYGHTKKNADSLILKYPDIVMRGAMDGTFSLRATVMALEEKEGIK